MKYILVGFFLLQFLFSVQLTPMTHDIVSMKKRNVTYNVINTEKKLAAAECKVFKVIGHDKKGLEIREETQAVVLYPSQFILQPLERKSIRLNYTGLKLPQKQEVYRVVANELALNLKEAKKGTKIEAGMKFIFSYEGLLFVGGSFEGARISTKVYDDGKESVVFDMTNTSSMSHYIHMKHFDFMVQTDRGEVKLQKDDFGAFGGIRLLPDETFTVKLNKKGTLKNLKVLSIVIKEKEAQ